MLVVVVLWVPEAGIETILVQSYFIKLFVLIAYYIKYSHKRGWALLNIFALCQVFAFDLNKRVDTTFVFSVRLFQEASLMAYLNYQQKVRECASSASARSE